MFRNEHIHHSPHTSAPAAVHPSRLQRLRRSLHTKALRAKGFRLPYKAIKYLLCTKCVKSVTIP